VTRIGDAVEERAACGGHVQLCLVQLNGHRLPWGALSWMTCDAMRRDGMGRDEIR
jgi:hypothetical protein